MKTFSFTKMHGLGNDFIVVNNMTQALQLTPAETQRLAHRHLGIGCDQVLLIEKSKEADFFCRILNADGSEAEQCGNGLRCVARFIKDKGLSTNTEFTVATKAGIFPVVIRDNDHIQVTMSVPVFAEPISVVFEGISTPLVTLSMGNPHAIMIVPSIEMVPVAEIGDILNQHPAFPEGVNVGFVEKIDARHILLRTFERGVGETYACGSNACAAAVAGMQHWDLESQVKVGLVFGNLSIACAGNDEPVIMTGPASWVFEGEFSLA